MPKALLDEALCVGKGVAELTGLFTSGEHTLSDHEVRVTLNEAVLGVVIDGSHGIDQELVVVNLVGERSELSNPDREVADDSLDSLKVAEEVLAVVAVPVDRDEIDSAVAIAGSKEVLEPVQALAGTAAVGDCGSTNAGLASEGVHEPDVGLSGRSRRKVGLTGMVGLVEAEQALGSGSDGLVRVGVPVLSMVIAGAPKHGNELVVQSVVLSLTPVVCPANLGTLSNKTSEQRWVVVGKTTLVAAASCDGSRFGGCLACCRRSGSCRGSDIDILVLG